MQSMNPIFGIVCADKWALPTGHLGTFAILRQCDLVRCYIYLHRLGIAVPLKHIAAMQQLISYNGRIICTRVAIEDSVQVYRSRP
jgi:hypothetical protein